MRRRSWIRFLGLVVVLLVLPACSSGAGGEGTAPPETGPEATGSSTSPSSDAGTTASEAVAACSLITEEDAEIALGAEVEVVREPFREGFLGGNPAEFAGLCAYRPSGSNDRRVVAIGVVQIGGAAPESITPWDLYELAGGGIPLGGPGDEGYAVDDGVLFRSGRLAVGIVVHTGEGMETDRAIALELAGIAADGLPTGR